MIALVQLCFTGRRDCVVVGAVLLTALVCVLAGAFPVWPGDELLLAAVQRGQGPALTAVFRVITLAGWYPVAFALTLAAVLPLLWRKRWPEALLVAVCASASLLTHVLKVLVGRPRPDYAIIDPIPHTMGFPSGHAAFALLLGGVLIYLIGQRVENRRLRLGLYAGLGLSILLVGLSRVYLGVHWPSDVLGGYLYGAAVLLVAVRVKNLLMGGATESVGDQ